MSLVKTGGGVTDIRGGFGGVYFTSDRSGLHCSSKPRRVHQITDPQRKQRNAFIKARTYTKDPRWVSYYIYRALNDLPFLFDTVVAGDPDPDCKGKYILAGTYNEKDYYHMTGTSWLVWYSLDGDWYIISDVLGGPGSAFWRHKSTLEGTYDALYPEMGHPVVKLELRPPPADYQIPKL